MSAPNPRVSSALVLLIQILFRIRDFHPGFHQTHGLQTEWKMGNAMGDGRAHIKSFIPTAIGTMAMNISAVTDQRALRTESLFAFG